MTTNVVRVDYRPNKKVFSEENCPVPVATASEALKLALANFLISTFAVWRITHLLWAEEGPWDIALRVRQRAATFGSRVFDCFYCLSFWVALPVALLIAHNVSEFLLGWFALSGGAIFIERLTGAPVASVARDEAPPDVGG